jgi:PAS domain S-box-containing protein
MAAILEPDLRRALTNGEIVPHFQPLVELRSGKLYGFEVLARWAHPTLGHIPPDEFIPIAEHNDLISLLTERIMIQAFAASVVFPRHLYLSVNISPLQLRDRTLPRQIERTAAVAGFNLDQLIVEITESALIGNLELARSIAEELKSLGMRLALDDFGTGYSSLRHLQALPFDEIKVDTSFVRSMTFNRDNRKIAAAVIGLGQSLGLLTIAEGIEEQAQADMLFQLGCDFGQGWLYGRPVPASQLASILAGDVISPFPGASHLIQSDLGSSLDALPTHRLAQLQAIYDGAPVGLCFLDRNLRYISLNKRLAELNGVPIGVHIGRTVAEIIPERFPLLEAKLRQALDGQVVSDLEITIPNPRAPGKSQTALISYQPARDEGGEVVGVSVAVVDITERKNAEQALRESEEHYQHAAELNPQIPWTADPEGAILEASPRWQSLTGMPVEQGLGRGWLKAVHPDDLAHAVESWRQSVVTGQTLDIEFRIGCGDGNWRWMRARAAPRRDAGGAILRWYGALEDIHERKSIQDALRASEEHFRNTVEMNPQIAWFADAQGKLVSCSARWEALTGLGPQETVGTGWARALHPDDLKGTLAGWEHSLKTRTRFDGEYRLRTRNGTYHWMRSQACPLIAPTGDVIRWYGTLEDIDEQRRLELALRQSEARLQAIFEAVPVGMIIAEAPSGRVILHNPRAASILRQSEIPDVPVTGSPNGHPLNVFHSNGQRVQIQESPLARAILNGETTQLDNVLLKRDDDSTARINLSAAPIRDPAGVIIGGVVAIQDAEEASPDRPSFPPVEEQLRRPVNKA